MNSYSTTTWAWEAQINALKSELEVQAHDNRNLREVVEELVDVLDVLSYRVGLTVKEVADLINPVGDKARAVLKGMSDGCSISS